MADPLTTPNLAQRLATSATGYAIVYDGVIDISTISDTRRTTAGRGISKLVSPFAAFRAINGCNDESCGCIEDILAKMAPSARIVTVSVEVIHG